LNNPKFIKLKDCRDTKDLTVCIDSIECIFKSIYDHAGGWEEKSAGNEYNFIRLKTGMVFEIKEPPDVISKLIK